MDAFRIDDPMPSERTRYDALVSKATELKELGMEAVVYCGSWVIGPC